jgi:hypothetical protein
MHYVMNNVVPVIWLFVGIYLLAGIVRMSYVHRKVDELFMIPWTQSILNKDIEKCEEYMMLRCTRFSATRIASLHQNPLRWFEEV